jgi:hypothetical protein
VLNRYFAAIMAETYPNGIYQVLRMIEWRWGLDPLTVRDATANNLADALDFAHADFAASLFPMPPSPFGARCVPELPSLDNEIGALAALAAGAGLAVARGRRQPLIPRAAIHAIPRRGPPVAP